MLKKQMLFFIFLAILFGPKIFGLEAKHCYIQDSVKHAFNQKTLNAILEKELKSVANWSAINQANYLSARITQIAHAMLENGFLAEAYAVPEIDRDSMLFFNCFSLWEGDKNANHPIPLTFLVYVWPSQELALKFHPSHPQNTHYASNIHCHPIPCAFAVLKGSLNQNNYEQIGKGSILLVDEQIFHEGEGDVDDLKKSFIHKLYNKGSNSKMCLSLHAYGLSSKDKVMKCFRETFSECSYH